MLFSRPYSVLSSLPIGPWSTVKMLFARKGIVWTKGQ
jgi:hypothetical protein